MSRSTPQTPCPSLRFQTFLLSRDWLSPWISHRHLKFFTYLSIVTPFGWLPTSPPGLVGGHHYHWLGHHASDWSSCFYSYWYQSILHSPSRILSRNIIVLRLLLQNFQYLTFVADIEKSHPSHSWSGSFKTTLDSALIYFTSTLWFTSTLKYLHAFRPTFWFQTLRLAAASRWAG